jgi:hypothetical protein
MRKSDFIVWLNGMPQNVLGILDICQRLQLVEEKRYILGRELLIRLMSMLSKIAKRSVNRARARERGYARKLLLKNL